MRDSEIVPGPLPAEVLRYWRAKHLKPTFSYQDVWLQEHTYSFAVAKIMRFDVLALLHEELDRAIVEGTPYDAWAKQVQPRLEKAGWWAEHEVEDPQTGIVEKVNPPSRLRLIFQTNMRTARAVGQWDRLLKNKRSKPYWLYHLGPSEHHRPVHVTWNGLLLPYDDEFWSYAFPPSAWGCKCGVRGVSSREADRLERDGVPAPNPEPELDDEGNPTGHRIDRRVPVVRVAPAPHRKPWLNKRTGKIEMVPEGVDPSFNFPPGEGRERALSEAAEE